MAKYLQLSNSKQVLNVDDTPVAFVAEVADKDGVITEFGRALDENGEPKIIPSESLLKIETGEGFFVLVTSDNQILETTNGVETLPENVLLFQFNGESEPVAVKTSDGVYITTDLFTEQS